MNKPTISFRVVINGPVATAGSTFTLFNINGITVPAIAAKMITANNATEIDKVNSTELSVKK